MVKPVPGQDAIWLALCPICDDMELFVSKGGFRNGGTEHCYGCGTERATRGMKESDIEQMKISAWCHWKKHPIIPYNWHTLTINQKWVILKMEGNCV